MQTSRERFSNFVRANCPEGSDHPVEGVSICVMQYVDLANDTVLAQATYRSGKVLYEIFPEHLNLKGGDQEAPR